MRRRMLALVSGIWLLASAVSMVGAQQPGGGFQGSPELQKWQDEHKYHNMLRQTFYKMIEMEKQGKTPLTKEQAKKVLDLLKPLTKKPKLTPDEAKQTQKKLQMILTADQLNTMARIKLPEWGWWRQGQGQGGFGGGGGAGGGQGGNFDPQRFREMMKQWRQRMKHFNPFYLPPKPKNAKEAKEQAKKLEEEAKNDPFAKRRQQMMEQRRKRLEEAFALLEKKAKS